MFYILLFFAYLFSILGVKNQRDDFHYKIPRAAEAANRYGRWYVLLLITLVILSFVFPYKSWWVELLLVFGTFPVSFTIGYSLSYLLNHKSTNFRTADGKGVDIAKMAEYHRNKSGK